MKISRSWKWSNDLWSFVFNFICCWSFNDSEILSCCLFLLWFNHSTVHQLLLWQSSFCCCKIEDTEIELEFIVRYCLYSNSFQSENIRQHAYFCNWEDSGKYMVRIQTALNMVMMRSKRACRLTAGKFASVDLPTFLAVCRFFEKVIR